MLYHNIVIMYNINLFTYIYGAKNMIKYLYILYIYKLRELETLTKLLIVHLFLFYNFRITCRIHQCGTNFEIV